MVFSPAQLLAAGLAGEWGDAELTGKGPQKLQTAQKPPLFSHQANFFPPKSLQQSL